MKLKLRKKLLLVLLFITIFIMNVPSVTAYVIQRKWYNTTSVTWYGNDDIAYNCLDAFGAAAYTWSTTYPYAIALSYGGVVSVPSSYTSDGYNSIIAFGMGSTSQTLMTCHSWIDTSYSPSSITEFDIAINTDKPWTTTGDSGCFDIQNVATHEFGHALFAGDVYTSNDVQAAYASDYTEVTMYSASAKGETKKRTPHQDDIDGYDYTY